jgi:hypothetical protein
VHYATLNTVYQIGENKTASEIIWEKYIQFENNKTNLIIHQQYLKQFIVLNTFLLQVEFIINFTTVVIELAKKT